MKVNAVSYARFSSNNQREASIEIQQEHINRYCKDNGITIIKEYVDRAFSATSDNRPSFQQMIKDSESGLFTYVVVYNSSRFCRNVQDHLKYRAILEANGVRIISVNENFDESTPEGDLMSNFMMSINQYYSKDLGRKTYLGCLETARECKHVGGRVPFGYYVKDQKYYINEKEAEAVRLMFELKAKNKTNKEICEALEKRGLRNRNNKKFESDFSDILRNKKYTGEFIWNLHKRNKITGKLNDNPNVQDVVRIPNGIPAIVSEELYQKVQTILDSRQRITNRQSDYLLSSLLKCGSCGYNLSVDRNVNGNGKRGWVRLDYRCYSRNRHRAECDTKPIRVEYLDAYIMNLVKNVLLNERYSRQIYKMIRTKLGEEYELLKQTLVSNQEEQIKATDEIKNLVNSLAEAKPIAYQEIVKEIERIKLKQLELESKADFIHNELDECPYYTEEAICDKILRLKKSALNKPISELKSVLKKIVNGIIVSNEEIVVKVNLNTYITRGCKKPIEMAIIEETANIKNPSLHLNQKLNWASLVIRT